MSGLRSLLALAPPKEANASLPAPSKTRQMQGQKINLQSQLARLARPNALQQLRQQWDKSFAVKRSHLTNVGKNTKATKKRGPQKKTMTPEAMVRVAFAKTDAFKVTGDQQHMCELRLLVLEKYTCTHAPLYVVILTLMSRLVVTSCFCCVVLVSYQA